MRIKSIIIEDYNNEWPKMFFDLKSILEHRLGDLVLRIEHVGSTAVPGLAAKPILDIDVVIDSMDLLPDVIQGLESLGYDHEGNFGVENREAFARKDANVPYSIVKIQKPEHHLYVCNKESKELLKHISFRDTLISNPEFVVEYANLKKELAIKYRENRQSYTDGKTEFVNKVLNKCENNL
ncbi:GrpB family protein [Paenibacillus xylanexedens]|uniref:GrpB family protein n=1 Tax=Paenibacillus xylanexedens TaxID=528191 RepID=UPI000F530063|nr:GrpB family protein [Paenibacillus xylanexedens]